MIPIELRRTTISATYELGDLPVTVTDPDTGLDTEIGSLTVTVQHHKGQPREWMWFVTGLPANNNGLVVMWMCGKRADVDALPEWAESLILDQARDLASTLGLEPMNSVGAYTKPVAA